MHEYKTIILINAGILQANNFFSYNIKKSNHRAKLKIKGDNIIYFFLF
jgi:hypothetical protein